MKTLQVVLLYSISYSTVLILIFYVKGPEVFFDYHVSKMIKFSN